MKRHFQMLAVYNARANERLYGAVSKPSDADYRLDRGAFSARLQRRPLFLVAMLVLSACAASPGGGAQGHGDRCLYAVEAEYGSQLRWDSCSHPPPYSRRID